MPASSHRRSFATDPGLCDRVFALLDTWIPTLSSARRQAERLRWRWEDVSTPFVHERDGQVVAHVGVLESRLCCMGRERLVGGIHAVCTLERLRRRGLYRALMEEALAHCDARYETVKLSTENPELYVPFGFRVIPEYRFTAEVPVPRGPTNARGPTDARSFRPLDTSGAQDLDHLDRLVRERTPPSRALSALDVDVFKFNAAQFDGAALQYCAALDLLAVMRRDGETLEIFELAAASYPDLATLLVHVEPRPARVVLYFRPDVLGIEAQAEPYRFDGDVLMVRGPLPLLADDGDLPEAMLSPLSRH